jgi:hypothetical protein
MYESPIELITKTIMSEIVKNQEEQVMNAVQGVSVNVDKDEILKALAYDRQQYQKGYRDGIRDVIEKLKEKSTYYLYAYGVSYTDEYLEAIKREMVGDTE